MRGSFGRAPCVAAVIVGALAAAPVGHAATRYAEPGGNGPPATCPDSDPCSLQVAVEDGVVDDGDEVVVMPGTYPEGSDELTILDAINLHGTAGSMPVITSSSALEAVEATLPGTRIADLAIDYSGTAAGIRLSNGATADRLYVKSAGTIGCNIVQGVLRDSVCWSTGASGNGIFTSQSTPVSITTTLRNVNAMGSGVGSDGMDFISGGGLTHLVDARNVIADGSAFDINAQAGASSTTTISLSNSNYATTATGGIGTATVTPAGSDANQIAPPSFVNAAGGDFRQTSGSPTVDAGTTDAIGPADIDGEARNQGAAPDIGADEFPTPSTGPNGDNFPPDTGIRKGPKRKTPKRKAKFEFGGSEPGVTFECRLDVGSRQGTFEPCTSPQKVRGLKRRAKYVFSVRAVDAAGNADPTPADRRWKVVKKE